jgi:hypothetical protein
MRDFNVRNARVFRKPRDKEIKMLNETKLDEIMAADASPMLTDEQLARLGGGYVAYVKTMRSEDVVKLFPQAPPLAPGMQIFALLAADGSPILLTDSRDAAIANALENSLQMVSLH